MRNYHKIRSKGHHKACPCSIQHRITTSVAVPSRKRWLVIMTKTVPSRKWWLVVMVKARAHTRRSRLKVSSRTGFLSYKKQVQCRWYRELVST